MSFIPNGDEIEFLLRRNVKAYDLIVFTPVRLVGPEGVAEECSPEEATHIGITLEDDIGGRIAITNLSQSKGINRIIAFAKALNPAIAVAARQGKSLRMTEDHARTA